MSASVKMMGGGGGPSARIFVKGLSESDTVYATKQVENPAYIKLPNDYTQLEYIESTGTQHIDTSLKFGSGNSYMLNTRVAYTTLEPGYQIMGFSGNMGHGIGTNESTWWEAESSPISANVAYDLEWYFGRDLSYHRIVDGVNISAGTAAVSPPTSYSLRLLATCKDSTTNKVDYHSYAKMYSATVRVNDTLVRDFIPAKRNSDGVLGLYDLVNNVFYTNAGSGTFIAGPEVTQYIDSGVVKEGKWIERTRISEYKALVPKMTSSKGPSGKISANLRTDAAHNTEWYAFDQDPSTIVGWHQVAADARWIQYEFENPVRCDRATHQQVTNTNPAFLLHSFKIQGSNDGINFYDISGPVSAIQASGAITETACDSSNWYKILRFVDLSGASADDYAAELQFYGYEDISDAGFVISRIKDLDMWKVIATNGEQTMTQNVLIDVITNYEIEMFMGFYTEFDMKEPEWVEEGGTFNYGTGLYSTRGSTKPTLVTGSDEVRKYLYIPFVGKGNAFTLEFEGLVQEGAYSDMGGYRVAVYDADNEQMFQINRNDGWIYSSLQAVSFDVNGVPMYNSDSQSSYVNKILVHKIVYDGTTISCYTDGTLVYTREITFATIAKFRIAFTAVANDGAPMPLIKLNYLKLKYH